MKVPLSWLRQYVDVDFPAEELADRVTMAGIGDGEVGGSGRWEGKLAGHG